MWPFRRKPKGRHALGAAVTSIPSAVPRAHVPVLADTAPVLAQEPPVFVAEPSVFAPEPTVFASEPPAQAPRVELGFRDGSTAALAPGSAQAKALTEIASILTHRD